MNIDIRNLEDKYKDVIEDIKERHDYINTNIDAAKWAIMLYPSLNGQVEELKKDRDLLNFKLKKVSDAMKLLGMNVDFESMESEYFAHKRKYNRTFFGN